jgi:hypothetical protein
MWSGVDSSPAARRVSWEKGLEGLNSGPLPRKRNASALAVRFSFKLSKILSKWLSLAPAKVSFFSLVIGPTSASR